MIQPPSSAPGIEPKPPITAAAKALIPMNPIPGWTSETGARRIPATAATPAEIAHTREKTRLTGIPT